MKVAVSFHLKRDWSTFKNAVVWGGFFLTACLSLACPDETVTVLGYG